MKNKIKAIVIFFILSLIMLSTKIMAQTNLNGQQYTNTSIIIITNNTRFGYGFSITSYNGLVYIYYTELKSSIATINGLVFNGTEEMNAPLPNFNDLGEGSPGLFELNNGSLIMLWGGVPMGGYSLNNLIILLQASILNNNVWEPVINLTNNGVALSYYSDGNYIYLVYEPTLSLTYNNTILEELTLSGNVIKSLNIPGIIGIVSANNGLVIVQFVNSTYALVNMNNGSIEFLNATNAGFVGNSLYQFYNGVLTINQNLTFNLPIYEGAFPISWNNGYIIIAWRPGLLSVYYWNDTELQPIVNYTVQFTIIPKATILNNDLYLAWFGLNNISTSQGSIYMTITSLPYQINQYNNITTTNNTINNTSTILTSNTSSYSSIQSTNTTSNKSLFSSIPIWVIIIVVGVVVFIILY
jgi:hypothetical protein